MRHHLHIILLHAIEPAPSGSQVDMTWSGHVHVYERTCPVLYKTCLGYDANGYPLAPVHLDIGNGGYVRRRPLAFYQKLPLPRLTGPPNRLQCTCRQQAATPSLEHRHGKQAVPWQCR